MTESFRLTVESRLERLGEIADFVQDAASQCGMNEKKIYDVQMAVDEACTNVIEHAYAGASTGTIYISCEKRDKDFVVTIRDYGKAFDPKQVAKPKTNAPLSKRNIGGLGLFFIYKMMDKVKFDFSSGNGNVLTMSKKIK